MWEERQSPVAMRVSHIRACKTKMAFALLALHMLASPASAPVSERAGHGAPPLRHQPALPEGWRSGQDTQGRTYYYHVVSGYGC